MVRSRRFLGGVGVGFLTTLGVRVGFFCPTPTPDVLLDHYLITLLNWEFLLKWYSFFWNFCWNRDFLLCTTISFDFNNSQISFPLRWGVGVGNFGRAGVGIFGKAESDSDTLPPTPQPWWWGAGCASAPPKVLICQKFEQNLKKFGQRSLDIFNNINEITCLLLSV